LKRLCSLLIYLLALYLPSGAQESGDSLEKVLNQMDKTAANFHTTQATFVWDQYSKVVDTTDTQKGKVYFRRAGKDTQMMAVIAEPEKYVLYGDGKIQMYEPKMDQVTTFSTGKKADKADVESFLVLGFGGSGHDLLKAFEVKYLGTEKIGAVETAKLDLIPKSAKVRGMFEHITLWIDPARGVSLQQQFFDPTSGDYKLNKYSDIELNQKIPDNVFKLKTTSKTKFVSPQG